MITVISDKPIRSFLPFRTPAGNYGYQLLLEIGDKVFESEFRFCALEATDELKRSFEAAVYYHTELVELRKKYPSEWTLMARSAIGPDGKRNFDHYHSTWHPLLKILENAHNDFLTEMSELAPRLAEPIVQGDLVVKLTLRSGKNSLKSYVYCKERVWSSRISLSSEQWLALVHRALDREKSLLERSIQPRSEPTKTRVILPEVRREVWRRDKGTCVVCGSPERLEFDHIIPVSMGGSNTARNVQLLCEACNRGKGATLG